MTSPAATIRREQARIKAGHGRASGEFGQQPRAKGPEVDVPAGRPISDLEATRAVQQTVRRVRGLVGDHDCYRITPHGVVSPAEGVGYLPDPPLGLDGDYWYDPQAMPGRLYGAYPTQTGAGLPRADGEPDWPPMRGLNRQAGGVAQADTVEAFDWAATHPEVFAPTPDDRWLTYAAIGVAATGLSHRDSVTCDDANAGYQDVRIDVGAPVLGSTAIAGTCMSVAARVEARNPSGGGLPEGGWQMSVDGLRRLGEDAAWRVAPNGCLVCRDKAGLVVVGSPSGREPRPWYAGPDKIFTLRPDTRFGHGGVGCVKSDLAAAPVERADRWSVPTVAVSARGAGGQVSAKFRQADWERVMGCLPDGDLGVFVVDAPTWDGGVTPVWVLRGADGREIQVKPLR